MCALEELCEALKRVLLNHSIRNAKLSCLQHVYSLRNPKPWRSNCNQLVYPVLAVRIVQNIAPSKNSSHAMSQNVDLAIGIEFLNATDITLKHCGILGVALAPIIIA